MVDSEMLECAKIKWYGNLVHGVTSELRLLALMRQPEDVVDILQVVGLVFQEPVFKVSLGHLKVFLLCFY